MTKFDPEPAQNASHLSHFAARHVFGEMPQRADTSLVRGIHARVRPLLLCCSPRALPTPGCQIGHTPQRLRHPSPPLARSLHPSASQSGAPMAAGPLLCGLPPSCSGYGVPLCCCCFHLATPSLAATIGRPKPGLYFSISRSVSSVQ